MVISTKNNKPLERIYYRSDLDIGQEMPCGSRYAGVSDTTHGNFFTLSKDSGVKEWMGMISFTQNIKDLCGRYGSCQTTERALLDAISNNTEDGGWRGPTYAELVQLIGNKDAIGGFKAEDMWYLSITETMITSMYYHHFRDNYQGIADKMLANGSVRCVWSLPQI